jgi:hypothetical protein
MQPLAEAALDPAAQRRQRPIAAAVPSPIGAAEDSVQQRRLLGPGQRGWPARLRTVAQAVGCPERRALSETPLALRRSGDWRDAQGAHVQRAPRRREQAMSDLVADSYYDWTFVAHGGDVYAGFMFHDTGAYLPGQILPTAYGYYQVGGEYPYGFDLGAVYGVTEGTVYTTLYYDAVQGYLQTANYPYYLAPSSISGLGSEYDYAWNGVFWDDFGHGGAYQAGWYG